MVDVTLGIALLLAAGFAIAKLGQRFRLPSVTGYIVAGLALGPSGLGIITSAAVGGRLAHFTQIALMLISFGIGEHLELKRLRHNARQVCLISLFEAGFCFVAVTAGMMSGSRLLPAVQGLEPLILALLLGAVSIATAPSSVLHVIREEKAAGPVTSTLLQNVAVNNGLAIVSFGMVLTLARQVCGPGQAAAILTQFGAGLREVLVSVLLGIATGLIIDLIIHHLKSRGEMLTIGLSLLLLSGEAARMTGLSPLLVGMAAGFAIVNRDHRDVRLFRALNAFEPPIHVLFFTLAGAHLELTSLAATGWIGLGYFVLRAAGKIAGAAVGAILGRAGLMVRRYLGMALIPQAGVAIGLVFLLNAEPLLTDYAAILTPVVLAGIFLAELCGPVATKLAITRAGETAEAMTPAAVAAQGGNMASDPGPGPVVPWTWERLVPAAAPKGVVLFGASRARTVVGLARISTLLAHYYQARPLAVRVVPPDCDTDECAVGHEFFVLESTEVESLGYELSTAVVHADAIAEALVSTARQAGARAIVLGYPKEAGPQAFQKVVEAVAASSPCQVVVVRFAGTMHTERILVPVCRSRELAVVRDVLAALSGVGRHRITLLRLMPSYEEQEQIEEMEKFLTDWTMSQGLGPFVFCRALAVEARQETIIREAEGHDLVIMAASQMHGLQRLFFGSLASEVAQRCRKPLLMIHERGLREGLGD